jgi:hypothetical protein
MSRSSAGIPQAVRKGDPLLRNKTMRVGILSSEADEVSSPKNSFSRVFFYNNIRVQNVNLQYILFTKRRITKHPFKLRPFTTRTVYKQRHLKAPPFTKCPH